MKIERLNPTLDINNIFLCVKYLAIIEKTTLPDVFPIKVNTPINPIINLLHSIPNSLTQLYPNLSRTSYSFPHISLDKDSFVCRTLFSSVYFIKGSRSK